MNDVEQAKLQGYRLLYGKKTSDQALEEVYEQEKIIELLKPYANCMESKFRVRMATSRHDSLMRYALLLDKEEKESLTAK